MPAGQAVQPASPAEAYVPAGQMVQPAAESVPGFVTGPTEPAWQMVQAATERPPKRPGVEMPAGQAVQLVAPAAA
jgi:hypothetical protein